MATDAQISGPLLDLPFSDAEWDAGHTDGMGIIGDFDGTAYALTLPPEGSTAELGSATMESNAVVDGRGHSVPKGESQSIDVPASATGGTNGRTDLLVLQRGFATAPGPVRVVRLPGTEGSLAVPSYNSRIDLPLYEVRRRQGESLNQALVKDRRVWMARSFLVAPTGSMPVAAPLGTRATRSGITYRRDMVGSSPDWAVESTPAQVLTDEAATASRGSGWSDTDSRLERSGADGRDRTLHLCMYRSGTGITSNSTHGGIQSSLMVKLHAFDKPPSGVVVNGAARVRPTNGSSGAETMGATAHIAADGDVYLTWMAPGITIGQNGPNDTVRATFNWRTAS